MYRVYNKDDKEIIYFLFDSITELYDYLKEAETSRSFSYTRCESMSTDYGWYGTPSLEKALEFTKYGYKEDYNTFINLRDELDRYIKVDSGKSKQFNDYIGYVPDVKAYLEGNPLCMINRNKPARKQVDIYYNVAINGATSTKQIYNRGVITLSLIELLEKKGFSVSLNVFDLSRCGNQIFYAVFNLKNTNERANPYKLYFPLCHNSFERRIVFRLEEVAPDMSRSWTEGYGRPCDDYTIRKILELKDNDIVFPQPSEMGITGDDIVEDTNRVFDYIKNYTHEKVELEHIKRLKKGK